MLWYYQLGNYDPGVAPIYARDHTDEDWNIIEHGPQPPAMHTCRIPDDYDFTLAAHLIA